MNQTKLPHIELIGDPEQNFYQLGIKDKPGYFELKRNLLRLLGLDYKVSVRSIVNKLVPIGRKFQEPTLNKWIESYCKGLEEDFNEYLFIISIPEALTSLSKWQPNLSAFVPGCSSFFYYDSKNKHTFHGRNLEFPIGDIFKKYERCITYKFPNMNNVTSFSTAGIPLPCLTVSNDKGLSLALHQIYTHKFNKNGINVFEMMTQLIFHCKNFNEIKKYVKKNKTQSRWGLYLSNSEHKVLAVDTDIELTTVKEFDLKDHTVLYFNNLPLELEKIYGPPSFLPFCKMKAQSFKKNYRALKDKLVTNPDPLKLLSLMTSWPETQMSSKDWINPVATLSTIHSVLFNVSSQEIYFNNTQLPIINLNNIIYIKPTLKSLKMTNMLEPRKLSDFEKGISFLQKAQQHFDKAETEKAYHFIQISISLLAGCPEAKIAQFFFIVWQYLKNKTHSDLKFLIGDLDSLRNSLPTHLNDHCLLFINRLETILKLNSTVKESEFRTDNLKDIFYKEKKLNSNGVLLLKKLTFPRLEIIDIIYGY